MCPSLPKKGEQQTNKNSLILHTPNVGLRISDFFASLSLSLLRVLYNNIHVALNKRGLRIDVCKKTGTGVCHKLKEHVEKSDSQFVDFVDVREGG